MYFALLGTGQERRGGGGREEGGASLASAHAPQIHGSGGEFLIDCMAQGSLAKSALRCEGRACDHGTARHQHEHALRGLQRHARKHRSCVLLVSRVHVCSCSHEKPSHVQVEQRHVQRSSAVAAGERGGVGQGHTRVARAQNFRAADM